ncbi:transposase [Deinococcus yunweiensis]|uniref:transposase n=1 Tax=Deinococcus yunweiensis TaxID=367282 RepID=UPI00398F4523
MVRRYELTDEQWSQLAPLLPPGRQRTGRPSLDHRTILNGIVWIKRSGSAWRDLPEPYGNWTTVSSRFYRWEQVTVHVTRSGRRPSLNREEGAVPRSRWSLHVTSGPHGVVVRVFRNLRSQGAGEPGDHGTGQQGGQHVAHTQPSRAL